MKPTKFILTTAITLFLFSCATETKEDSTQVELLENQISSLEADLLACNDEKDQITDSLSKRIQDLDILVENMTMEEENEGWEPWIGEHLLTLQWIEGSAGKVNFELMSEGEFTLVGEQRNKKGDYVTIDGTALLQENGFRFMGVIKTKVSYINNGEECVRDGDFSFKNSGKRKYWRLQEMDNCEGNNVVDYVDIYFK